MAPGILIVVSGLPASGKSTVARILAHDLQLPVVDKDTILKALFDSLGCPTPADRTRLSRASDEVLFALAAELLLAILVNWWHHDSRRSPTEVEQGMQHLRETFRGPLDLGGLLLRVATNEPVDRVDLVARIRRAVEVFGAY